MEQLDSRSIEQAKKFLTRSLLGLLSRDQTARTINAILSAQIERLLIAPIGRLGDHVSPTALQRASAALVGKNHASRQGTAPGRHRRIRRGRPCPPESFRLSHRETRGARSVRSPASPKND